MANTTTKANLSAEERLDANALRVRLTELENNTLTLTLKMLKACLEGSAAVGEITEWSKAIEAACAVITTLREELRDYQCRR